MTGSSLPQGAGIALGLLLGVMIGLTLLDSVGLGAALGLVLGAVYEGVTGRRKRADMVDTPARPDVPPRPTDDAQP